MNISGIRPYEAINNYFRINEEKQIAGNVQENQQVQEIQNNSLAPVYEDMGRNPRQNETSFDFAGKYDPAATYSMKGKEKELADLDRIGSVSPSYKDDIIKEYQFFINPAKASEEEQINLQKRARENFDIL